MRRILDSITPLRQMRHGRALKRFVTEEETRGIHFAERETPNTLAMVRTVLIDSSLIMEGWDAVRMAAAPIRSCPLDRYKRQGSWMMLTAGVALGCNGYGPLATFAREMSFESERMARQYPKLRELPYSDDRQIETTVHRDAAGTRSFAKGAPAAILFRCTQVLDGKERPMDDSDRNEAMRSAMEMERYGMETLAFATKWVENDGEEETGMTFLGLIGMGDLPDYHAPEYMQRLRTIGVRPVFVAKGMPAENAIRVSGALRNNSGVLTGSDVANMPPEELLEAGLWADAFVDMDNEQRRRLARALRRRMPTAIIAAMPGGEIAITTGQSEVDDVTVRSGGLKAVVGLLERCRTLTDPDVSE